ncbi:MAG: hypothetical protein WCF24_13055 [Acidimicrobiales bacterium]
MRSDRRTKLRAAGLGLALAAVAVLDVACGNDSAFPGVAANGPSTTTTTSPGSARSAVPSSTKMLEFAQCMRSHGVSDFPETVAPARALSANPSMQYLGNSFNPNSPTYQRASAACEKYAVASPVTAAGAAKVAAEQLKYAHCMRSHGVSDFPDPSANGGFPIPKSIDENSSTYRAAESACKGFLFLPRP